MGQKIRCSAADDLFRVSSVLFQKLFHFLAFRHGADGTLAGGDDVGGGVGEAEEYEVVLETQANALDCSDCAMFREAGFPEAVYVGIIANTPRTDATVNYLEYLIAS